MKKHKTKTLTLYGFFFNSLEESSSPSHKRNFNLHDNFLTHPDKISIPFEKNLNSAPRPPPPKIFQTSLKNYSTPPENFLTPPEYFSTPLEKSQLLPKKFQLPLKFLSPHRKILNLSRKNLNPS